MLLCICAWKRHFKFSNWWSCMELDESESFIVIILVTRQSLSNEALKQIYFIKKDYLECFVWINHTKWVCVCTHHVDFVQGYHKKKVFLATQGPLPDTADDFWRMIFEQKSSSIVMLAQQREGGKVKIDKTYKSFALYAGTSAAYMTHCYYLSTSSLPFSKLIIHSAFLCRPCATSTGQTLAWKCTGSLKYRCTKWDSILTTPCGNSRWWTQE